jgi:uncharacterized membrane protein YqjE
LSFAAALLAVLNLEGEKLYLSFSAIAATAIALVSLEHLVSSKSNNTVRQQVYVTAGVLLILGIFTLISWEG